ncbi:hypothetical protein D0Z07_2769 [Hyphodiscus hymeniophilus]|uniref:Small ribosomal subunit protein mS29 n=1 Tax=Hyphodiscus hymeniophilus TaxID=353542 RepID=A0A9P6VLM7_9HELO|nr:hypothetical protein D0Z07_2769 [Hyphodiscus hymeniophilus]
MASSTCWKCLSRPSGRLTTTPIPTASISSAPFSTTARFLAMPKQTKPSARTATKGSKSFAMKKKVVVKSGKPPMPGERKAMRKRIVLSNTNALQVEGLEDLSKDMDMAAHTGKVVGIPGDVVDSLRAAEAFKVSQGWGMFRRPALLIREESVKITESLKRSEEEKKELLLVVDGERGTAQELTNAVTEYSPIPKTTPTLYSQNTYTANWLSQILKSNNAILQSIEMDPKRHNLPIPIRENITLARLCELGARDPDVSWPIFQVFWSEITAEGRPPVLMALDGLNHVMHNSLYRTADFKEIHSHDLVIVKHFMECLSRVKTFPNGGAILAATSRSHAPASKSMELMIRQTLDQQNGDKKVERDPFERKYDPRAEESLKQAAVMRLSGLTKHEARGLMEYWAQSGVLRQAVDERSVTEKWALAGNGIVGEIGRGALRMRI